MSNFNDRTLGPSAQPTSKGTSGPTGGRGDDQDDSGIGGGNSGENSGQYSSRKAGVVIRAFVEHIGLVGDTELTVNVKWPASTFCVPSCGKPASTADATTDSQQVPPNGPLADFGPIYGPSADPGPAMAIKAAADAKAAAAAADTSGVAPAAAPSAVQAKKLALLANTQPTPKRTKRKSDR
jgi:hypothetical protein